jgi:hypothetical protein
VMIRMIERNVVRANQLRHFLGTTLKRGDDAHVGEMHKNTKLTPVLRKEIFQAWKKEKCSQRELGRRYHVDKRVIGRIIDRGTVGDFSVHDSTVRRYQRRKRLIRTSTKR